MSTPASAVTLSPTADKDTSPPQVIGGADTRVRAKPGVLDVSAAKHDDPAASSSMPAAGATTAAAGAGKRHPSPPAAMSDLELVAVLGEGAFGLVRLVRSKRTGEVYALKQMQKARIVAMNQTRNVVNEKTLLSKLKHPFILRYVKAFKNRDCLYLLTEYCAGGDLFGTLLRAGGTLRTADARWYAACVTTVLEHLHNRRICYR